MHGEKHWVKKDFLMGSTESHLRLQGIIERCMKDAISRFHKAKKDDLVMGTASLFEHYTSF